jgi:hypothetical protein
MPNAHSQHDKAARKHVKTNVATVAIGQPTMHRTTPPSLSSISSFAGTGIKDKTRCPIRIKTEMALPTEATLKRSSIASQYASRGL